MLIIVGTNRENSTTSKLAKMYQSVLKTKNIDAQILNLQDLPPDFVFSAMFQHSGKNEVFNMFQQIIDASQKIFVLVPEYNGSFPGVFKGFLDALRFPNSFKNKKVALVGLSAGVLGNAVGLGHLDDVLSYMGANTLGLKIKLGLINQHFDGENLSNETYRKFINLQIDELIAF